LHESCADAAAGVGHSGHKRQYLYFSASVSVNVCTFVLVSERRVTESLGCVWQRRVWGTAATSVVAVQQVCVCEEWSVSVTCMPPAA
jgi:hypothetical protein